MYCVVSSLIHPNCNSSFDSFTSTIDIARSNWSYIPFILGAYANPTIGFYKGVYEALQAPIGTKLWFAGEHTAGEEDYAYTHGAYKSGKAQANALIKCIREGICPEYNATLTKKKL